MMKLKLVLAFFFVFMGLTSVQAQIKEREEAKPPANQKPAQPIGAARANVNITWKGSGTVIIQIDDRKVTLGSNESEIAGLKSNEALELFVQIPGKKYFAREFLKIDNSGGDLEVNLSGDNAVFSYESLVSKRQQEQREAADRRAAEQRLAAEKKAAAEQLMSILPELEATMVSVAGGTFTMGCTSEQVRDCFTDQRPAHQVTVSDFQIGKYEVTQEQWRAVMGGNPSHNRWECDSCPVETVSWNDVQDFISRLNQMIGKRYRLPTEAEWEYASRGGNKSGGYVNSGSNDPNTVAWYDDNSERSQAVGQKSPNELGLYDMSGNVWEWCQDWYGDYSGGSQTNPRGPSTGSYRVRRGGSWNYVAKYCLVADRGNLSPDNRGINIGFRLAL